MLNTAGRNMSYGHSKRVTSVHCCLPSFSLMFFYLRCFINFRLYVALHDEANLLLCEYPCCVRYYTYVGVFPTMYAIPHI